MTNLITLAGEGSRFRDKGVLLPKPMVEVDGTPMIIKSVSCLPIAEKNVFVCREEHLCDYKLDKLLSDNFSNCEFVVVKETTEGQACTAEYGINMSSINSDDPILISCCDYGLDWNQEKFNKIKDESDVVVWATTKNEAFSRNPSSYSWLEIDNNNVKKTHVKQSFFDDPYNNHAIVGPFYFAKSRYFVESLNTIYQHNIRSNNEFYIDNIFNTAKNLTIKAFTVDDYHCWGTPEDLKNYEDNLLG